jgi:hypothetical protein
MATMTHTDRVLIRPPAQVCALLTQVAARMFDNSLYAGEDPLLVGTTQVSMEIFQAWQLIRETAHLYGTHGMVYLDPTVLDRLTDALILAHRNFHFLRAETPYPEACNCELSEIIRKAMTTIFAVAFERDKQEEKL